MTTLNAEQPPLEDPSAELERQLFHAYLAGAGVDMQTLLARDDEPARKLLAAASLYASAKLTEAESRLRYLRNLHGEP